MLVAQREQRCEKISAMTQPPEDDPVLRLIDAVIGDIAVSTVIYVARRREDGDAKTFVIQFGEDGRFRLGLPDPSSDTSIEAVVAEAQARLAEVVEAPVPLCPQHQHALLPTASAGQLKWVCPEGGWQAPLGDYAELAWPHFGHKRLAPLLAGRLERRGIRGVATIAVRSTERGAVAEFGVPEMSEELGRSLKEAAAPLPVNFHYEPPRMIRVGGLPP